MRRYTIAVLVLLATVATAVAFISDTIPGFGVVYAPPATGTYAYNSFVPANTPGFSYTDPVFNQTVRRLTTDHGKDDIYGRNMWWNANETRYLHATAAGTLSVISVATGVVTHSGIPSGGPFAADAGFDPVDPNALYYYGANGIHRVTLQASPPGFWTDALYWAPPGGASLNKLGGSINWLDRTGRYMVVRYGPEPSVYVYDRQNLAAGPYANPIDGHYVDSPCNSYVGISPDAQYIVGYCSSNGPNFGPDGEGVSWQLNHVARTVATTPNVFWTLCGGHGAFISPSDGRDYMVVANCYDLNQLWRVDITNNAAGLDNVQQKALPNNRLLIEFFTWHEAVHIATVAQGDWAFVSTEDGTDTLNSGTPDPNGKITPWHPYRQEIIQVNVITPAIRRLAHHRSRFFPNCNSPYPGYCNYYNQPRVSVGWSGKVVGFASNFNQLGGDSTGVVDIYALPLPQQCGPCQVEYCTGVEIGCRFLGTCGTGGCCQYTCGVEIPACIDPQCPPNVCGGCGGGF